LTATVCSLSALISELASEGFSRVPLTAVLKRMQQAKLLLSGGREDLSGLLNFTCSAKRACQRLVVCMTGAIQSAYFGLYLLHLKTSFCEELKLVLTKSAQEFVQTKTLLHVCASEVYSDPFQHVDPNEIPHMFLSRWASCVLVAPATAASLHRIAQGSCDDLTSLTVAATPQETPVVIAPSMNELMWRNPAIQQNVGRCRAMGYWIIEPGFACEVSKQWKDRDLRVGGFGAQLTLLPAVMARIVVRHRQLHTDAAALVSELPQPKERNLE
jgi:hypothetical protein